MSRATVRHAVVIGAGSAGLASAAELHRLGLAVTVLEAGDGVGAAWAGRYRSLRLNTLRALSGLPGLRIPSRHGNWVSGSAFAEYLQQYAEHYGLDVLTGMKVLGLTRSPGTGWLAGTPAGELAADVVVIATGNAGVATMPDHDFTGTVLHSAQYQVPEEFTGDRVLVVGSGNSATEIATDLLGHADHVWLSVRTPPLLVTTSQLGVSTHRVSVLGSGLPDRVWDAASRASHWSAYRDLTRYGLPVPPVGSHTRFRQTGMAPVAERGFARAVRTGQIEVVPGTRSLSGPDVLLSDGATLRPDAVILATGYRPSYPDLLADLAVLGPDGAPLAWAAPLPAAAGLFVVGAPSLQGDLREHGREAKRVARAVHALAAHGSVDHIREGAR
jgi:cation diffusion facilitator CzcD-associated flavoprotein CzcO